MENGKEKINFIRKIHEIDSAGLNQINKIGDVIYNLIDEKYKRLQKQIQDLQGGRTIEEIKSGIYQVTEMVIELDKRLNNLENKMQEDIISREKRDQENDSTKGKVGRKPKLKMKEEE